MTINQIASIGQLSVGSHGHGVTGKGLWAELELIGEAECLDLLKGSLLFYVHLSIAFPEILSKLPSVSVRVFYLFKSISKALPMSGVNTGSFCPPLSFVRPRWIKIRCSTVLHFVFPHNAKQALFLSRTYPSLFFMISLLLTGKPCATTGLANLGHAKELNRYKRPGIGLTIFIFSPETLQIYGLYDMIQGVVATVGRPIQNSLPRVLGGRDRFLRRADLNF